jgi:hypothetical protein
VKREAVHVEQGSRPVEPQRAALHRWRLRTALAERGNGGRRVVAQDAGEAADAHRLRERLESQEAAQRFQEGLLADVPVSRPGAQQQQVAEDRL